MVEQWLDITSFRNQPEQSGESAWGTKCCSKISRYFEQIFADWPDLLQNLISVQLWFRQHQFAVSADIEVMF